MAITKLGAELMQKRADFTDLVGNGGMGRFIGPAFAGFDGAQRVLSGNESVGGAIGGLAGGIAGYHIGGKLMRNFTKNMKSGIGRGILGFVGSMGVGALGDVVGSHLGNKMPIWKRKPKESGAWLNDNYYDWNGRSINPTQQQ